MDVLTGELDTCEDAGANLGDGVDVLAVGLGVDDAGDGGALGLTVGTENFAFFVDGVGVEAVGAGTGVLFEVVERPEFGVAEGSRHGGDGGIGGWKADFSRW